MDTGNRTVGGNTLPTKNPTPVKSHIIAKCFKTLRKIFVFFNLLASYFLNQLYILYNQ